MAIPIVGAANAGDARNFAEQNIEGYLRLSSTFLGRRKNHKLFALKVDGPSMNRACVAGNRIEDGDYVIVDSGAITPRNGDVVLSIIDGMANIKKFHRDAKHEQILLMADSTDNFPPIVIHSGDSYSVNGTVIHVVKKPKP